MNVNCVSFQLLVASRGLCYHGIHWSTLVFSAESCACSSVKAACLTFVKPFWGVGWKRLLLWAFDPFSQIKRGQLFSLSVCNSAIVWTSRGRCMWTCNSSSFVLTEWMKVVSEQIGNLVPLPCGAAGSMHILADSKPRGILDWIFL